MSDPTTNYENQCMTISLHLNACDAEFKTVAEVREMERGGGGRGREGARAAQVPRASQMGHNITITQPESSCEN